MKIKDRLMVMSILPQQGNFVTIQLVAELKKKVSLAPKELEFVGLKTDPNTGNLTWDDAKDKDKEFAFHESEKSLIQKALVELEGQNKLTPDHIDIYKQFVLKDKQDNEPAGGDDTVKEKKNGKKD